MKPSTMSYDNEYEYLAELQAENARLQEQNDLLIKELNALKEVKQEECPDITISP